jgi:hypothetical protein
MSPPTSRPPAGVPQGGNAKYAIVAVLLLLGIGAIVALRAFGSRSEAPAPAPSMTALEPTAPPSNPRLDDIPPPPPPEEVVDAGPGPRLVSTPSGGCEGKCVGVATPELEQALAVRGGQARRCYNQALALDSSLKGRVSVAVRVGPSGNVCSATVASNDMRTPAVANCAANIFRAATYPPPRGGCVEANVPLSFVLQGH